MDRNMNSKESMIRYAKILCGILLSFILFILGFLLSNYVNHMVPVIVSLIAAFVLGFFMKKYGDRSLGKGTLIGFFFLIIFVIFILRVAKGMH